MELALAFGRTVREIRKKKGISQEKLAGLIEVDRTFMSKIERGIHVPNLAVVFRLADVLEVPAPEIIRKVEAAWR